MSILPWSKKKLEKTLSAYVDGELDSGELAEIGERVVFEPHARELLDLFRRVKGLVDRSVISEEVPSREVPEHVWERVGVEGGSDPVPERGARRRQWNSATILSVGLLVTAGVALVGLRRRGLV
jgi:anti-sigma factor RsiW